MHVRFTTAAGLPVMEEGSSAAIGTICGILIHPDRGGIEGFFVRVPSFLHSLELFLPSIDILHWGSRVRVRSAEALSSLEDLVRLRDLAQEGRPVLGQRILTESGVKVGRCADVQFDTKTFRLEWLFPRRWLRWGRALPTSSVVLVRQDAVIVRDAVLLAEDAATGPSVLETIDPLRGTAVP